MNDIQLIQLEDKLATVMRIATQIDSCSPDTIDKLIDAYRKIKLSRLLLSETFVAIAGTQGAGKTTLLSSIYNASDWLQANSGRGEQIPVFVYEDATIDEIKGVQVIYNSEIQKEYERECSKQDFQNSITYWNYKPNENERVLYVKLRVPVVYNFTFSWVLLPGYENENYKNSVWQRFMRYVLAHSIGVVLVTREERLAHNQSDILEDLKGSAGSHKPIIAITRSEGIRNNEEKKSDLINRATEVYEVEDDKIVFTGIDFENWKDDFSDTVVSIIKQDLQVEQEKRNTILDVIDGDLTFISDELQSLAVDSDIQNDSQQKAVENILDHFNKSSAKYKKELEDKLLSHTKDLVDKAITNANNDFENEETGVANNAKILLKKITFKNNEVDDKRKNRVLKYFPSEEIMRSNLKAINQTSESRLNLKLDNHAEKLLNYSDEKTEDFEDSVIDNKAIINSGLNTLLRRNSLSSQDSAKNAIMKALDYLPALAMEYSRIVQASSLADSEESNKLSDKIKTVNFNHHDLEDLLNYVTKDIKTTSESAKAVMGIVGSLVGLDMADGKLDGEINYKSHSDNDTDNGAKSKDSLDYLTKASVLGTRMAGMAVAIGAVAYTSYKVSNTVALADKSHREFIGLYANQIGQQNISMVLQQYDKHMEKLSEFLRQNLEEMYCVNNTDQKHQLMVALKQLKLIRKDVRRAIKNDQLNLV
ncbi:hypothetical protein MN210_18715 [Psychrobacter raelei]|uniref:ATP-binding protein n=1 Tax=Psychrobacter raelei TaxID=2565531 RepID=A0AAU6PU54_9GAMM